VAGHTFEEVSMSPKTQSTATTTATRRRSTGFTAEERAAMKERSKELKTAAQRGPRAAKADGESDVLAKIADMPDADRKLAERVHAIVKSAAPELAPRTWYGMPAYAKEGKVLCFFKNAGKFKTRYATFGFSDTANLDDGNIWPTEFAVKKMTADVEARLRALVKQAAR
jgi:uncharacterized protein YdhG (YjbR/CyaY superfamily)